MRRSNTKERARTRILTDDEIRAVWKHAEANGTFGAMVRLLLLTAQRREKVAAMRWQDIAIDGTWTIPAEVREKGNALELVLPDAALVIIKAQPRFASNPYVFAGRGNTHFSGYSKAKAAFDAEVQLPEWRLHDLRRTARSLMSRARIRPDISERVMGHAIAGIGGTYDRHSYREEKAHAVKALAGLVEKIVNPPVTNVTPIRGVM
jgi:integrase